MPDTAIHLNPPWYPGYLEAGDVAWNAGEYKLGTLLALLAFWAAHEDQQQAGVNLTDFARSKTLHDIASSLTSTAVSTSSRMHAEAAVWLYGQSIRLSERDSTCWRVETQSHESLGRLAQHFDRNDVARPLLEKATQIAEGHQHYSFHHAAMATSFVAQCQRDQAASDYFLGLAQSGTSVAMLGNSAFFMGDLHHRESIDGFRRGQSNWLPKVLEARRCYRRIYGQRRARMYDGYACLTIASGLAADENETTCLEEHERPVYSWAYARAGFTLLAGESALPYSLFQDFGSRISAVVPRRSRAILSEQLYGSLPSVNHIVSDAKSSLAAFRAQLLHAMPAWLGPTIHLLSSISSRRRDPQLHTRLRAPFLHPEHGDLVDNCILPDGIQSLCELLPALLKAHVDVQQVAKLIKVLRRILGS